MESCAHPRVGAHFGRPGEGHGKQEGKAGGLAGLIHHSDRGRQYCCKAYTQRLKEEGIRISTTESGNPKDNAITERMNNTVKNELCAGCRFRSLEEAESTIRERLCFYNYERPHMSNGSDMLAPMDAYGQIGTMQKQWLSYRDLALLDGKANGGAVQIAPAGCTGTLQLVKGVTFKL